MTKRKTKTPASVNRNKRQRVKKRFAKAREDAQLAGVIPTVPTGTFRREGVDPSTQGEQPLPGLIGQAIRNGWAVPEDRKPRLVDEMVAIIENPEVGEVPKVMAYNALQKGDQVQWERDNPELAGKTKGSINVSAVASVGVQVDSYATWLELRGAALRDNVEEQINAAPEESVKVVGAAEEARQGDSSETLPAEKKVGSGTEDQVGDDPRVPEE